MTRCCELGILHDKGRDTGVAALPQRLLSKQTQSARLELV